MPRKVAHIELLTCSPQRCTDLMFQVMSFIPQTQNHSHGFSETLTIVLALREHDDWKKEAYWNYKRTYLACESGSHWLSLVTSCSALWSCLWWLMTVSVILLKLYLKCCRVVGAFLGGGARGLAIGLSSSFDPWDCIKKKHDIKSITK